MQPSEQTLEEIISYRKKLLITQQEMANILGYSVSGRTYGDWEKGKSPPEDLLLRVNKYKQKIEIFSDKKFYSHLDKRKIIYGAWNYKDYRLKALKWVCNQEEWKFPEGLYNLDLQILKKYKLSSLISACYNSSMIDCFEDLIPDYKWRFWLFKYPSRVWSDDKRLREYLIWFEEKNNITKPEDWYKIKFSLLSKYGRGFFTRNFNGSVNKVAKWIYPDYNFLPWKFIATSKQVFDVKDINNMKIFVEHIANEKGYKSLDEYYGLTKNDLKELYQSIKKHWGGYSSLLKNIYPEYDWKEWLFLQAPHNFWDDDNNVKRYLHWLEKQLDIKSKEDWYNVTLDMISKNYGEGMLKYAFKNTLEHSINVFDLARFLYPKHNWNPTLFDKKYKAQAKLYNHIVDMFPKHKVEYNRRYSFIKNEGTNRSLELDIYIPELKLALEYQGEQHYKYIERFFHKKSGEAGFKSQQKRDELKKETCKEMGIKLIEVSYKWDGTKTKLIELLSSNDIDVEVNQK